MNDLIVFGIQLAILLPLIGVAALLTRSLKWGWLAAALAFAFVDFSLTAFVPEIPWFDFKSVSWNWVGKGASVLFSLAVLWWRPDLRADSGVVLAQRKGSLALSLGALAVLLTAAVYFGLQGGKAPFKLETLLFQLTMPSLSEELVFRGIFLCLLHRALGSTTSPTLRRMGWAVPVVALWFGLGHAVYWADHSFHVAWFALAFTGTIGAILIFMRVASGSILFPALGHTLFNVVYTGLPMIHSAA